MYTTGHSMAPVGLTLMFSVLLNTDVDRMKNQAAVYAFLLLVVAFFFSVKGACDASGVLFSPPSASHTHTRKTSQDQSHFNTHAQSQDHLPYFIFYFNSDASWTGNIVIGCNSTTYHITFLNQNRTSQPSSFHTCAQPVAVPSPCEVV